MAIRMRALDSGRTRMTQNPPLLKAAVALILVRLVLAIGSALFLNTEAVPSEVVAFSAIAILISTVGAYFIWNRKRWAAWVVIAFTAFDVITALPAFVAQPGPGLVLAAAIGVITGVTVIILLRHRTVWPLLN
jgi:hypothetical protein